MSGETLAGTQPAQSQVRLQLTTRDEAIALPAETGPILVPTSTSYAK